MASGRLCEPEVIDRDESTDVDQPEVDQFKDQQTEKTDALELRTSIQDIPISEKLMMMHLAEQNSAEKFQEENTVRYVDSSPTSITDEDRLEEIIARHSDSHSRLKSTEKAPVDCGAPVISDSDSTASNLSEEYHVLPIVSGDEADPSDSNDDEKPGLFGNNDEVTAKVDDVVEFAVEDEVDKEVRDEFEVVTKQQRSQYDLVKLSSFAELLGEYNWYVSNDSNKVRRNTFQLYQ